MEVEAKAVRKALAKSHPEIEFEFKHDLSATIATVAMIPPEDMPEAEIDRVGLLFLARSIEREMSEVIAQCRAWTREDSFSMHEAAEAV